jgi:hypothetical protein
LDKGLGKDWEHIFMFFLEVSINSEFVMVYSPW